MKSKVQSPEVKTRTEDKDQNTPTAALGLTILLTGSMWGFLEATIGGLLHMLPVPVSGEIMAPIGFTVMFWGLKIGLKAQHVFLVAVVAATFKFADTFLFALPLFDVKIVNPAQAIVMQGLAFAAITKLFSSYSKKWTGTVVGSALLYPVSTALFVLFSTYALGYAAGPIQGGASALATHIVTGSLFTLGTISAAKFALERVRTLDIGRLSPLARAATAIVLIIAALMGRKFIA